MILSALSDPPAEGRRFHGLGSRKSPRTDTELQEVGQEVPEEEGRGGGEREGGGCNRMKRRGSWKMTGKKRKNDDEEET